MGNSLSGSVTVRLGAPAMRKIRARARSLGVTPSQLIREVIAREVGEAADEASLFELTEKWVGCVRSSQVAAGRSARESLESWRPDRRG